MKLSSPVYKDSIRQNVQTQFGGWRHTDAAQSGELYDMRNLSSDAFPLIQTRQRRMSRELPNVDGETVTAFGGYQGLYWVAGTRLIYHPRARLSMANAEIVEVSEGRKVFAHLNDRLIVFPDKVYMQVFDAQTEMVLTSGSLEAVASCAACHFTDGDVARNETGAANALWGDGLDTTLFAVGDAVEIGGCQAHPENNTVAVIRQIAPVKESGVLDALIFDENLFTLDAEGAPYIETGTVTVARTVPDMDTVFACNNRLWGCRGSTIYASKLGDPTNWKVFDGLSTDSWSTEVLSEGNFTGGASFGGYPVFFKENSVCKVYGSLPEDFRVVDTACIGVAEGFSGSLAVADNVLYYWSQAGVCAYTGGVPTVITTDICERGFFSGEATAGSDMERYYLCGRTKEEEWALLVYDTARGVWHREDGCRAVGWAFDDGALCFADGAGRVYTEGEQSSGLTRLLDGDLTQEDGVCWMAEFGDLTAGSPNRKAVSKLNVRAAVNGTLRAWLRYDGGAWEKMGEIRTQSKQSVWMPVLPRRADYVRLKLEGQGDCTIYSVAESFYTGSDKG